MRAIPLLATRLLTLLPGLALLATAALGTSNASAATLRIEAAKASTEWGHPLTVRVILSDPRRNLNDLDLSVWRQQMDIDRDEVKWRDPPDNQGTQTDPLQVLRLRLHPLRPGPVELPPLEVSGAWSEPLNLDVKPSHQQDTKLLPVLTLNTHRPWQRQQTVLTLSVDSPDAYALLQAEQPLELPGFEVQPLPLQRQPQDKLTGLTRLTIGWALYPLLAGDYRLKLPPIQYRVNGRKAYSWHLPAATLYVQALPGYLPPTLPVGQLSIHSQLQPGGILRPDQLAWWNITISGPLPAAWLPTVEPIPDAASDTTILAPEKQLEQQLDAQLNTVSIQATRRQQIPFRPASSGRLQLPTAAINWFDPHSGRVQRQTITAPPRWVIARHWILTAAVLATLIGLTLLYKLVTRARRSLHRRRDHLQALAQLAAADNAQQLRLSLHHIANAHGWGSNLSIRAWLACWQQHYRVPAGMEATLTQLSSACYRPQHNASAHNDAIKQRLLEMLRHPKPQSRH